MDYWYSLLRSAEYSLSVHNKIAKYAEKMYKCFLKKWLLKKKVYYYCLLLLLLHFYAIVIGKKSANKNAILTELF